MDSSARTGRRVAVLSTVLIALVGNGAAEAPSYSIATIEYLPGPLEPVGKLQAGLLCLPKGKLRWRDLARPSDDAMIARLSEILTEGGLAVAARADRLFADPEPQTTYRVKVVVETVKLRLCIGGLGIGEMQPKGEGQMKVRWETYDRQARAKIDSATFDVALAVRGQDARGTAGVVGDAIVETARRYAASRPR